MKRLGILLFDGVEELDAVGPWEVLSWWTANFPDDGYVATLFSVDGGPVTCAKGMTIVPQHSADDVGPLEVLLHPGGRGTRPQVEDPAHLDRVRALAPRRAADDQRLHRLARLRRRRPAHRPARHDLPRLSSTPSPSSTRASRSGATTATSTPAT